MTQSTPTRTAVLVGLFSARQKDYLDLLTHAADLPGTRRIRVERQLTQRRGVSDGGVAQMSRPFSSRTVVRSGKLAEIVSACQETEADLVVFVNELTKRRRDGGPEPRRVKPAQPFRIRAPSRGGCRTGRPLPSGDCGDHSGRKGLRRGPKDLTSPEGQTGGPGHGVFATGS
jgi:hypothetical protein